MLRWAGALLGATLTYFLLWLLVLGAWISESSAVIQSVITPLAIAAGAAGFVLVATAAAPSHRKALVSLSLALSLVLVRAVLVWRNPARTGDILETLLGASCAVLFFFYRTRVIPSLARHVRPPDVRDPSLVEAHSQGTVSELVPGESKSSDQATSDSLILALASVASYAATFAYEAGYCWLYRVPLSVISLSLTTAFVAAAAGASALVLSYTLLSALPRSVWPSNELEIRRFAWRLTVSLFPLAYTVAVGLNLAIVVAAGIALYALTKSRVVFARQGRANVTGLFFEKANAKILLELNLVTYVLLVAFVLGRYKARSEPQFIFDKDSTQYIVLRIYGDNIVAEPYVEEFSNQKNLIVGGGLRFFKVADKETPEFRIRPRDTSLSVPRANLLGEHPWRDWLFPYR